MAIDFKPIEESGIDFRPIEEPEGNGQNPTLTKPRLSRAQVQAEIEAKSDPQPGKLGTALWNMLGGLSDPLSSDASPVSMFANAPRNLINFPHNTMQVAGAIAPEVQPPAQNGVPMIQMPRVSPEGVGDFMRNTVGLPVGSQGQDVGAGLMNGLGTVAGAMTTPENAVTLPLMGGGSGAAKALGTLFTGQMIHGMDEVSKQAAETVYNPESTDAQKVEALAGVGAHTLLTTLAGGHSVAEKPAVVNKPSELDARRSAIYNEQNTPRFEREDTLNVAKNATEENVPDLAERLGSQLRALQQDVMQMKAKEGPIPVIGEAAPTPQTIVTPEQAAARPGTIITDEAPGRSQRDLQGGQVSFSADATAKSIPNARQSATEPLMESMRPAESRIITPEQGDNMNPSYRRPQPAPTEAEFQKRQAKESVRQGLYMQETPMEPLPQEVGQYPEGREMPRALSKEQSGRIQVAHEKDKPESYIKNQFDTPNNAPIDEAAKFEQLKEAFRAEKDPKAKMDIWAQLNAIQNKNGGMAPGKVRGTSVPPKDNLSGAESSSSFSTLPPVEKNMTDAPRSFLDKTEAWADAKIKEGRKHTPTLPDPELLAAQAIKGAIVLGRGVKDFAGWSAEMVKQFGENIKPHLQKVYDAAKERMDKFQSKSFSTTTEKELFKDKPFGLSMGKDGTLPTQSVMAKMRQLVGKDEMAALQEHGIDDFLRGKERVSMPELQQWLSDNGPQIEVKKLEGTRGNVSAAQKRVAELGHIGETRGYHWEYQDDIIKLQDANGNFIEPRNKEEADFINEFNKVYKESGNQASPDSATARFTTVNPKPLDKMPGAVDVLVRRPFNKKKAEIIRDGDMSRDKSLTKEAGIKFEGGHFGQSDKNILGWTRGHEEMLPDGRGKVFLINELQKDWGQVQEQSDGSYAIVGYPEAGRFKTANEGYEWVNKNGEKALAHSETLALKATIQHAKSVGAKYIALSDAETAMLTEGHDRSGNWRPAIGSEGIDPRIGQTPEQMIPQYKGMKLHYDTTAPNILEKLTGSKGEVVDFGEHQNAVDVNGNRLFPTRETAEKYIKDFNHTGATIKAAVNNDGGYIVTHARKDLIFRNPDGTPKTTITARMYPLEKIEARLSENRPMSIYKTELGAGIPLPPQVHAALDYMTPKQREMLTEPEMATATAGKIVKFRDYDTEKKIAVSPQGAGRVPMIGTVLDPRSVAKDAESQAIISNAVMSQKGDNFAALYLEGKKTAKRAFEVDKNGEVTLAGGKKGHMSDVIEAELKNPGSQPLTPEQRQFVADWKTIKDEFSAYAKAEGVKRFVTGDNHEINIDSPYFPRPAIGKHGVEATKMNSTATGPGAKQFMQKGRYYETEAEGSRNVKYEGDEYNRIARYMSGMYKAIADQRLADDPALKGRPLAGQAPKFLEEGMVFPPAFHGRVFPLETARKLNRYYGEAPHQWVRHLAEANDFIKSFKFTMDASTPFNQGLPLMGYSPLKWARTTLRSYQAFFDENVIAKQMKKPDMMGYAQRFVENGGSIGRLQDFLAGSEAGKLATKIPIAGRVIEASGRSMGTFLSLAKLELYKSLEDTVPKSKLPELVEAIENTVLSGRMEGIGLTPGRALGERMLFNAPSYMRAALNLAAMAAQGGISGKVARRAICGMAGVIGLSMYGMYKANGMSDDEIAQRFNPANSKFMRYPHKLSNGDVIEVGPGNILIQMARIMGTTVDNVANGKKTGSGVEGNPWLRWASYRGSPLVRLGSDIWTGKDALGRPVTAKEALAKSILPIAAEQFVGKESMESKATEATASFAGLSSMPESFSAAKTRLLNVEAKKRYGKDYTDLSLPERKKVVAATEPEIATKKPLFNESSAGFAVKADNERKDKLVQSLSPEVQAFVEKHGVKLAGYDNALTLAGKRIPLDEKEQAKYAELVAKEYERILKPLLARENFDRMKPELRQHMVEERLDLARKRARTAMSKQLR